MATLTVLPLILLVGGLLLTVEGLARVTWNYSLFRRRKLTATRAERRHGPRPRTEAASAALVAAGLTLATVGLVLYL